MLQGYFDWDETNGSDPAAKRKRLMAVQAALDIAKASAGAAGGDAGVNKLKFDLSHAASHVGALADAIQAALDK